jgi:pSer/pThr/pTyr-binding forkhead associated (FHA) protein
MFVYCPDCQTRLKIDEKSLEKKKFKCPKCGSISTIPPDLESKAGGLPKRSDITLHSLPQKKVGSLPEDLRLSLSVIEGNDKGKTFHLSKPRTTFGRETADIILNDPEISRTHATLIVHQKSFTIEDLDSTNGTFINDKKIKEIELKHLDEIEIGGTRLLFTVYQELEEFGQEPSGTEEEALEDIEVIDEPGTTDDSVTRMERRVTDLKLPAGRKLSLEFLEGENKGERIEFPKGRIIIGRSGVDINLNDPNASRKHAVIEAWSREQIYLRDLASTNGTFLNGARITSARLKNGDEILIGSIRLRFVIERVSP